jgi:23S rRNA (adenine2503-C2)-methyltransferase
MPSLIDDVSRRPTRTLADFDLPALQDELKRADLIPSHAKRLLRAYYDGGGAIDFSTIDVGRRVRAWIESNTRPASKIAFRSVSVDGTVKLLLQLEAGGTIETVLMPGHHPDRAAGCVSSQVGCAMGCDFCASTRAGLERNLTSGEIVEQFLHLRSEAAAMGRRLTSLVFMGMGEPMHNLDNVIPAIRRISSPAMGAMSGRHITLSTVGIVPGIERLGAEDLNVHLALSLHAPDDETRSRLVPANRRYRVGQIMEAAKRFQDRAGRIVTIEYCMLDGINDSDAHATALADLMNGFRAHVNLIPYNPIGFGLSGIAYRKPGRERVSEFLRILWNANVVAHVRETRGDDVSAACGQLRQAQEPQPVMLAASAISHA